ncbi:MAG: outer-membrane lipoprotein carrier protein LolA [Arcobacteraceae bacterium]|nr:outer-membrane lipoprotein carrier protein LolA [Arcobacteraceae bacterium]
MKVLSILLLTTTLFYGQIFEFTTYKSNFTQTVTNSSNNKIEYKGEIYITEDSNILWKYLSPVKKNVYIDGTKVMIVEPELEQVILSTMEKELNLFNIINNSQKVSKDLYKNDVNNILYTIKLKNNLLFSINYMDEIENKIEILFINSEKNIRLSKNIFQYTIPNEYDIIKK